MKSPLEFEPEDWAQISEEGLDLIKQMLNKDQTQRITIDQASNHPWLSKWNKEESAEDLNESYLTRL